MTYHWTFPQLRIGRTPKGLQPNSATLSYSEVFVPDALLSSTIAEEYHWIHFTIPFHVQYMARFHNPRPVQSPPDSPHPIARPPAQRIRRYSNHCAIPTDFPISSSRSAIRSGPVCVLPHSIATQRRENLIETPLLPLSARLKA